MTNDFDLDIDESLVIDEYKDYAKAVTDEQPEYEVDNDCGDACKL